MEDFHLNLEAADAAMKYTAGTAQNAWRRRHVIAAGLGALVLRRAWSQEATYPQRTVRLVVPLSAGSSPDVRARALAERLSAELGQRFVVENRPGAGTTLGSTAVAEAPADGHTLLVTLSPALQTGPLLYRSARYDPMSSFTAIGSVSRAAPFLVVNAAHPARSARDLVELSRSTPGGLALAFSGPGGVTHLPAELLRQASGANFLYVPYKSEVDSLPDLVGQRIDAAHYYGPLAVPQVRAGRLRALAYAGTQRNAALPEVPTYAEAGFAGVEFHVLLMLLGPAGLPAAVVERLSQALRKATQDAGLKAQFELAGSQAVFGTAEQTLAVMRQDAATAGRLITQLRITPE